MQPNYKDGTVYSKKKNDKYPTKNEIPRSLSISIWLLGCPSIQNIFIAKFKKKERKEKETYFSFTSLP
jgi:hypothetical protein